jgi:hypothetical protein
MKTSTHRYHDYQLVLHHESDDRYRITILDSKGNRIASTSMHLEREGALTEASHYVDPPSRAAPRHMRRDAPKVDHLSPHRRSSAQDG